MPARHVEPPSLDRPLSLVAFSCEVWLHHLLENDRNRLPNQAGYSSQDAMFGRLTEKIEALPALRAGLAALRRTGEQQLWIRSATTDRPSFIRNVADPLSSKERRLVRLFIRVLDDHLARTRPERVAHLLSFYTSVDVTTAAEHDWVDPASFFSAWAAGDSRSKYEVLDRGQKAATLVVQFGDRLNERLATAAQPASPHHPHRTLDQLLRETSKELLGVVSLPASSGSAAATRQLAAIGEIGLDEMRRHLFGEEARHEREGVSSSFGSVGSWRLPRVLTRIGEILASPEAASQVWGVRRAVRVGERARELLAEVLTVQTPNLNPARSLVAEMYRYLDDGDRELQEVMLARLKAGRTVRRSDSGGWENDLPFGEEGILPSRHQAYIALALCEKNAGLVPEVCAVLRSRLPDGRAFPRIVAPVEASRSYAAAFIEHLFEHDHRSPPMDAFIDPRLLAADPDEVRVVKRRGKTAMVLDDERSAVHDDAEDPWAAVSEVKQWFDRGADTDDSVRGPVLAVWEALRSGADPVLQDGMLLAPAWRVRGDYRRRVSEGGAFRFPADQILDAVPFHAQQAARSLVAQAVLSVDGTGRREAVEALRQAGLADVSARLFELVVTHCRQAAKAVGDDAHRLDWLREQAVFCMSYTGSLDGFDTLVREAGLITGGENGKWDALPDPQPACEAWIRTTALLGLSDLGDTVDEAQDALAGDRVDMLVDRIRQRLQQLADEEPVNCSRGESGAERPEQLMYIPRGEEHRALVAVLAMLRSRAVLDLLHILSGRPWAKGSTADDKARVTNPWAGRPKPMRVISLQPDPNGTVDYERGSPGNADWDSYMADMGPVADRWDLMSWQLAEWGLQRADRRFPALNSRGVRITDPLRASQAAEHRMRTIVVYRPDDLPEETALRTFKPKRRRRTR